MDDNGDPRERRPGDSEDVLRKKDKIFEDVLKLLVDELGISPTDITPDLRIMEDLSFDSLQIYELVIDLEEEYDIRMPDDVLDTMKTVSDVVDLVYVLSNK